MDKKAFLEKKLELLKRDNVKGIGILAEPLSKAITSNESVKINADGNWFKVSFDAVKVKEDRAVI